MQPKYKIEFDEKNHKYYYGGCELPGVSEILSNVGTKRSADSGFLSINKSEFYEGYGVERDFGVEVHRIASALVRGDSVSSCSENLYLYKKGIENFLFDFGWFNNCPSEMPLCDPINGYGGTPDLFVIYLDGTKLYAVDWKTSESESSWWKVAIHAYYNLIQCNFYNLYKKVTLWNVMLGPQYLTKYKIVEQKFDMKQFHLFQSILNVYKHFR